MKAQVQTNLDPAKVLSEALVNAGKALGLTQAEIGDAIGKYRTSIATGIDPHSKAGTLALYLIRIYRSLFALVDGDADEMQLWMKGFNRGTNGIPKEQIQDIAGVVHLMEYLDAMRGKI